MYMPKHKEHLKGLWRAIWGTHEIPGYSSMVEVLYLLRGDRSLVLRLGSCNENALHPFIYNREGEVVGTLVLSGVFVGLNEEGWIASDAEGNYRPTKVGLERLAWHERLHLEAGDCPECGKQITFFPAEATALEKDSEGRVRRFHHDCYIAWRVKRGNAAKNTSQPE